VQGCGNDGAQGDPRDRAGIDTVLAQNRDEEYPDLVRGAERLGRFPELAEQCFAVEHAPMDLSVAYVEAEEHGGQMGTGA